jgi:hypothetical protein
MCRELYSFVSTPTQVCSSPPHQQSAVTKQITTTERGKQYVVYNTHLDISFVLVSSVYVDSYLAIVWAVLDTYSEFTHNVRLPLLVEILNFSIHTTNIAFVVH